MATSLHSLFLTLVIACISIVPTYSTSRGSLHDHHTTTHTSFQVKLQHVDSGKNFTKFELLQRALERSNRSYGDGSSTQGYMGSETFTFESTPVPNIGFGCGQNNSGFGGSNGEGLVRMGRGPLSLPSQVNANQFSYCMTFVDSTATCTLQIGSLSTPFGGSTVTTPLIQNPQIPTFYYLGLNDISVGGSPLGIPQGTFALHSNGSGGLIIDSGTTITSLVTSAYSMVKQAFTSQTNLPAYTGPSVGFDCFFQSDTSNVQVPSIVMHFNGADVSLPTQNYFIEVSQGVVCLAMKGAQNMSIYGNIQQQNFKILYDLSNNVLSFTPTECGSSS
ncbi:hypothetical protein Ancab_034734 [Ancistrocladus abbreviatus]